MSHRDFARESGGTWRALARGVGKPVEPSEIALAKTTVSLETAPREAPSGLTRLLADRPEDATTVDDGTPVDRSLTVPPPDPAAADDEPSVPARRRRDPSRHSLEIRSDGRSFYLPATVAWVMAACVVMIAAMAAFDPPRMGLAAVEAHADRVARWERAERTRQTRAIASIEEPLRALRRQALERGLVPEGVLAPSDCAAEPGAHLEGHALEAASLTEALRAAAAGDAHPDATLPSRSPIELSRGEFFLAPDRHLPGVVRVSSSRGPRVDPVDGDWKDHKGLDISAPSGTPVIATADGVVTYAGTADSKEDHLRSLLGTHVVIEHGETGFVTLFAHLSAASVTVGQEVRSGDRIGAVGNTGRSTGPHLHYQVMRDGRSLDPLLYIADVVLIADGEAIRFGRKR